MEDAHVNYIFSEEELSSFARARVGTYFIIPLRTTKEKLSEFTLRECADNLLQSGWSPYEWRFDDLYQHINDLFSDIRKTDGQKATDDMAFIGINYDIPVTDVLKRVEGGDSQISGEEEYYVLTENEREDIDKKLCFRFRCMQIVIMHTGIGFLIIGIESRSPRTYDTLLHAGYNQNRSLLGVADHPGRRISFSDVIQTLLEGTGMTDYAGCLLKKQPKGILRDTTAYSVAIIPELIAGETSAEVKGKVRQLCLNLRHARAFGTDNNEDADEDSFINYAALNSIYDRKVIRWGIYTFFERAVQVMFRTSGNGETDPINIHKENREDNYLPFLILSLYERYSYLFFTETLRSQDRADKKRDVWLEGQMLRLKAFGVVMPGDMTPYNNENEFLKEQRIIYDIDESLKLIDDKISIIQHIRAEEAEQRQRLIEKILAAFGIVSILCDSLGLLGVLLTDTTSPHPYWLTLGTEVAVIAVIALASVVSSRRK